MTSERVKGADEKFCESCGEVIKLRAELCPKCGVRQRPVASSGPRNKLVAALLALLLGGLGIHKFYLGQKGLGILYLVFFWTFIPAIVALIEGIGLLLMSEEKFAEKYSS